MATHKELVAVLSFLRPNSQWNLRGTEIEWLDSNNPKPTDIEIQAAVANLPASINLDQRNGAISQFVSDHSPMAKVERAILLTIKDEINILRQRDVDRAVDVAAATSLADLKVRWAARSALDPRTIQQAKTSVENKINTGEPD